MSSPHSPRAGRTAASWRLAGLLGPLVIIGVFGPAIVRPAGADAVSDFFAGKSVSLITGFPPGGGYDSYIRVLARHYGKYVPGHPAMIPSNMPGAGSLTAGELHLRQGDERRERCVAMFGVVRR